MGFESHGPRKKNPRLQVEDFSVQINNRSASAKNPSLESVS